MKKNGTLLLSLCFYLVTGCNGLSSAKIPSVSYGFDVTFASECVGSSACSNLNEIDIQDFVVNIHCTADESVSYVVTTPEGTFPNTVVCPSNGVIADNALVTDGLSDVSSCSAVADPSDTSCTFYKCPISVEAEQGTSTDQEQATLVLKGCVM